MLVLSSSSKSARSALITLRTLSFSTSASERLAFSSVLSLASCSEYADGSVMSAAAVPVVAAAGVKKGVLMKTLRAALLGSLQGPDLLTTWLLLQPSGEARGRIERSL